MCASFWCVSTVTWTFIRDKRQICANANGSCSTTSVILVRFTHGLERLVCSLMLCKCSTRKTAHPTKVFGPLTHKNRHPTLWTKCNGSLVQVSLYCRIKCNVFDRYIVHIYFQDLLVLMHAYPIWTCLLGTTVFRGKFFPNSTGQFAEKLCDCGELY